MLATSTAPHESRSPATRVLVLDGDDLSRALLHRWLSRAGFEVRAVATLSEGRAALADGYDVLCLDLGLPAEGALQLIIDATEAQGTEVVALAGSRHRGRVPDALRRGAFDFVPHPLDELKVVTVVKNGAERRARARRLEALERIDEAANVDGPPHHAGLRLPPISLDELERVAIEQALERHQQNVSAAVRELGIGRTTIYRKLRRYQAT